MDQLLLIHVVHIHGGGLQRDVSLIGSLVDVRKYMRPIYMVDMFVKILEQTLLIVIIFDQSRSRCGREYISAETRPATLSTQMLTSGSNSLVQYGGMA